jgi:peroxiredoxin
MLRILKGLELFDVHVMMHWVKSIYQKKVQNIIDNDNELANDIDIDSTNIG